MKTVAVSGQLRENLGKKGSKATRLEGLAPAVLYGDGDPIHLAIAPLSVRALIYTPEFKIAELTVGGKEYRAIIKDIQFHPVTDEIQHLDFLALQDGHPIKVSVPVAFEGNSPGIRPGGKLIQAVRKIKMKAAPEFLVDRIVLDISELNLGDSIRVRDIQVLEGVEIINPGGQPVATIEVPRALKSAATAALKVELSGGAPTGDAEATEE
jgi:large subunit ribosomal protein L25